MKIWKKLGPSDRGLLRRALPLAICVCLLQSALGDQHLKFRAQDPEGAALEGIAFNAFQTALGPALLAHGGKRFHLAGKLNLNIWNGRKSIQLVLDDAALA